MWKFQINESHQWDGWNDTGVREFRTNILKNLAREIIQNSLDAGINLSGRPVEVNFSLDDFPRECIPGLDEITDVLKVILSENPIASEGADRLKEIEEAYTASKKANIKTLRIEDFNTSGMEYAATDYSKPFNRYIYATGSTGHEADRGGSHGLGKAAPLATSPLRTIYVSTCWKENDGSLKKLYQGRCKLMSRKAEQGIQGCMNGTGFWGTEDFRPLEELSNDNFAWLRREKRGTTISVPCFTFDPDHDWVHILGGYVVSEFFGALSRGNLKVTISDNIQREKIKLEINQDTIKEPRKFFESEYINEEIKKYEADDSFAGLTNADWYYQCISENNGDVVVKENDIEDLGTVRLRLLVKENSPRSICFLRKNMKITEKIKSPGRQGLWDPGYRTHTIKDFVGVVEILSSEGNELLRAMEPPQHNALDIDQMPEALKQKGRVTLDKLSRWLRRMVEELAPGEVEDERIVSELGEYFHDADNIDPDSVAVTDEVDPNSPFRLVRKPLKIRRDPIIEIGLGEADGGEDGGNSEGGGDSGGGGGNGPGEGDGTGGTGNRNDTGDKKQIRLSHQRIVGNNTDFIINLSAKKPFNGKISLFELGLDVKVRITNLKSSSVGEISDGYIEVKESHFTNNKLKIEIQLENPVQGGLAVAASESQ